MTVKCYATSPTHPEDQGFKHSRVIMDAFSEGCKGQIVPPTQLFDGPAAMYGILRGTDQIIRQCEWVERDYYYVDHGYLGAGHYRGHYRVTKNGRQADIRENQDMLPPDRINQLGISPRPWVRRGNHVLVIPITGAIGQFYGIDEEAWLKSITQDISKHTDRPIVVKPKWHGSIKDYLKGCWCVVTHSSNVAVDAIVNGIPAVVTGESACEAVSWRMADIESPQWPERDWWLRALAYHQWTLDEMRSGECWRHVK